MAPPQKPPSPDPGVAVLLPFRDAAETLGPCLDSILGQTFGDFELLAVDDHGADRSTEILHACADPRIRILPNPGRGLVDALNAGLRAARAPLVARMDADDLMHPERLALQRRHFSRRGDLCLSATRVELFPVEQVRAGYREYVSWQNALLGADDIGEEIYIESPFAHPSVMYRRDAVLALGGYRQGDFPEDYDLWLRMHRAGLAMEKLPRVLLRWRESPQRLSRRHPAYRRAAFDRLRARFLAPALAPRLAEGRNLVYWGAGRRTRKRARLLIEKGFPPAAWVDIDPGKIGNRINGVPVVGPSWLESKPRPFVLVYVTNHGARERIAGELERMGYRRGRDYLAVG